MKTVAWRVIIAIVQGRWLNHQKRFCWSKTNVKHHWNTYLKAIGLTFTALPSIRARWKTKAKQFTGAKVLWVMELSEVPFLKFEQKQIGVIWLWRKIWKKMPWSYWRAKGATWNKNGGMGVKISLVIRHGLLETLDLVQWCSHSKASFTLGIGKHR